MEDADIIREYHDAQKYLDEIKAAKSENDRTGDKPLYSLMGRIKALVEWYQKNEKEWEYQYNSQVRAASEEIE